MNLGPPHPRSSTNIQRMRVGHLKRWYMRSERRTFAREPTSRYTLWQFNEEAAAGIAMFNQEVPGPSTSGESILGLG